MSELDTSLLSRADSLTRPLPAAAVLSLPQRCPVSVSDWYCTCFRHQQLWCRRRTCSFVDETQVYRILIPGRLVLVLAGANTRAPKPACIELNHGFDPASVLLQVYPSKIPYLAPEPLSHPWTRRSTSDPCNWMTLILLRASLPSTVHQHLPIQTTYTPSFFYPFQSS